MALTNTQVLIGAGLVALGLLWPVGAKGFAPSKGGGYAQIRAIAGQVEQATGMKGFTSFALAVATNESKGNNLAANTSTKEAAAACRGYDNNRDTRYKNNKFPRKRWCFGSGGYYGILPSTGLAAPSFHNADPYLVFDPVVSTVLLADFVRRVIKGFFHKLPESCRNWLTIKRFMASNKIGLDCNETLDRSVLVRERFERDLKLRGRNVNVMYQRPSISNWPGDWNLYLMMSGHGPTVDSAEAPMMPSTEAPLEDS